MSAQVAMAMIVTTPGLVECDASDEAGSLVARASSTCLTLRGEQASGR